MQDKMPIPHFSTEDNIDRVIQSDQLYMYVLQIGERLFGETRHSMLNIARKLTSNVVRNVQQAGKLILHCLHNYSKDGFQPGTLNRDHILLIKSCLLYFSYTVGGDDIDEDMQQLYTEVVVSLLKEVTVLISLAKEMMNHWPLHRDQVLLINTLIGVH